MNETDVLIYKELVRAAGGWFRFPLLFLYFLECDEAVFLSYLLNQSNLHSKENGWFYATRIGIQVDMALDGMQQKRLLQRLGKRKLVQVKMVRGKRFLRIMVSPLSRYMRKAVHDKNKVEKHLKGITDS
jgi:hypothetical protein